MTSTPVPRVRYFNCRSSGHRSKAEVLISVRRIACKEFALHYSLGLPELGKGRSLPQNPGSRTAEAIQSFLRQQGSGTVSELQQAIGVSRRVAVPLLEKKE